MESMHDRNHGVKSMTALVFHCLEYKRSPEAFLTSLLGEPCLLDSLIFIGGDAKLIAPPGEAQAIVLYLEANGMVWSDGTCLMEPGHLEQLKPRHIVCTEDFRQCVCETISGTEGACRLGMVLKRSKEIAIPLGWLERRSY